MIRKKSFLIFGAVFVAVLGSVGAVVGYKFYQLQGQAPHKERIFRTATGGTPHYDPIQYRAKDSRPAIMKPKFVSAQRAQLAGGVKGMGVTINGDSRFYPLFILQYHQILNDTCGDKPVVCSY